eukprot:6492128-Amphidinium_carterae.2
MQVEWAIPTALFRKLLHHLCSAVSAGDALVYLGQQNVERLLATPEGDAEEGDEEAHISRRVAQLLCVCLSFTMLPARTKTPPWHFVWAFLICHRCSEHGETIVYRLLSSRWKGKARFIDDSGTWC